MMRNLIEEAVLKNFENGSDIPEMYADEILFDRNTYQMPGTIRHLYTGDVVVTDVKLFVSSLYDLELLQIYTSQVSYPY